MSYPAMVDTPALCEVLEVRTGERRSAFSPESERNFPEVLAEHPVDSMLYPNRKAQPQANQRIYNFRDFPTT